MRRWVLLSAALVAMTANAQPPPEPPKVLPHAAHGLFTGDEWRFRKNDLFGGLFKRVAADLVAIPSGAPWWTASEWGLFGGVVGSTIALSAGTPSLDVRFHYLVHEQLLPESHFTVWNQTGDLVIWPSVFAATLAVFIYGIAAGDDRATELAILMAEAFAVAQLYHNMIKLLTGRAGPGTPELEGHYFGPARGYQLWPAGTPSGHMASMYSLLAVLMYTFDHPALWVGLNLFALAWGASLVGDNYHWLSDVTLGAAIGFCVGRWVVLHRSSQYVYGTDEPSAVRLSFTPILLPGSGGGLGIMGTF